MEFDPSQLDAPNIAEAFKDLTTLRDETVQKGQALLEVRADYENDPDPASLSVRRDHARAELRTAVDRLAVALKKFQVLSQALIITRALGAVRPRENNPVPTDNDLAGFVKYQEVNEEARWIERGWRDALKVDEDAFAAATLRAAAERYRRTRKKALVAGGAMAAVLSAIALMRRRRDKRLELPAGSAVSGPRFGGYVPAGPTAPWAFGSQWPAVKGGGEAAVIRLLGAEFSGAGAEVERVAGNLRKATVFRHPGVRAVSSVGVSREGVYLIVEPAEGRPLVELLSTGHSLGAEAALRIMTPVAAALDAAHAAGLAHGSLTPERIMVLPDGSGRMDDFGVVRALTTRPGVGGQFFGPAYAAPEVLEGKITLPSDLFAFGVVLYEMLFVRLPFEGTNLVALKQERRFPLPSALLGRSTPKADAFFKGIFEPAGRRRRPRAGSLAASLSLEALSC